MEFCLSSSGQNLPEAQIIQGSLFFMSSSEGGYILLCLLDLWVAFNNNQYFNLERDFLQQQWQDKGK